MSTARTDPPPRSLTWERTWRGAAGPLLITAGVLFLLRSVLFRGSLPGRWTDVLALWLPTHCLLGHSLAAGHIQAWNPHVMAGVPFAADPQSGWMYLPAMALYAAMPCHAALGWFIAFQPVAGGLGLYAFLRTEGLSRPAATLGGVGLSLAVAGSDIAFNLPFSATLAWTAVLLALAARYVRARTWGGRLLLLIAVAVAWGQLAAALLTNGLALGTGALLAYLCVRLGADVAKGRRPASDAVVLVGLLVPALLAVNLAYLWPRLAYLPSTSIGLGYRAIDALSQRLAGSGSGLRIFGRGFPPPWPLRLGLAPGVYLGAATLVLALGAWRTRRHRALGLAFAGFGAASYLLTLASIADAAGAPLESTTVGQAYLHDPQRFAYGLVLAFPVLAAIGADALFESRRWRDRAVIAVPGLLVWAVLPAAFGAHGGRLVLLGLGGGVAGIALWAALRRPELALLLPLALAADLVANGLLGEGRNAPPPAGQGVLTPHFRPGQPAIPLERYTSPGPIARALEAHRGSRYISLDPAHWNVYGYQLEQEPADWGLMATQRSMIFGLEEAQGYNSVQLRRYWEYVRAVAAKRIKYNVSYFAAAPRPMLDLLQVGWIVGPRGSPPAAADATPVAVEGGWALFRVPHPPPRASLLTRWRVEPDAPSALGAVTAAGFDPSTEAVIEGAPRPPRGPALPGPSPPHEGAMYRRLGPQTAVVVARAPAPAILLIRNSYDPNWHATVDGRPATLLVADFFLQGVAVPPGRHVVTLRYGDPTIGYGLAGSAVSIAVLLAAAVVVRRRRTAGGTAGPRRVAESPADGGEDEREAAPARSGVGVAPRRGGGVLRRGRLGPGGRDGGEDAG